MIFFKRRRLIWWLLKAYFKKNGKSFIFFFFLGFLLFAILKYFSPYLMSSIITKNRLIIGAVGAYTADNLPDYIQSDIAQGLTTVSNTGVVEPGIAKSWGIKDNGKTYVFHLKHNLSFSDSTPVTSQVVNYNFADVAVKKPDKYTVIFSLKEPYSPFLVTVSRPIYEKDLIGVGNYKVNQIAINGSFIQTLSLVNINDRTKTKTYHFYPTQDALKNAYVLGEITQAIGVDDPKFEIASFNTFPNTTVTSSVDNTKLVTLFYNTQDSVLSDKRVRLALSYALPDTFSFGKRNYIPYPASSMYANVELNTGQKQDFSHSRLLLSEISQKNVKLTISTLPEYEQTAETIKAAWSSINVQTSINVVDSMPTSFQIYLGDFNVPKDPDQYVLWHSGQQENITNYKNLRIDLLLEEGRKTTNTAKREKIYQDFQKYLLEDMPASFLYFPVTYTLERK